MYLIVSLRITTIDREFRFHSKFFDDLSPIDSSLSVRAVAACLRAYELSFISKGVVRFVTDTVLVGHGRVKSE